MEFLTALFESLKGTLIYSSIPGGLGGLVFWLSNLQAGRYKNNKLIAKFLIEILGGSITASFLAVIITSKIALPILAFLVGLAWSAIILSVRKKVTTMVLAAISDNK